jgi:predicted Holliday junction resolvase-like endonuclease
MIEWILLITIVALLILFWQYIRVRSTVEERAIRLFRQWRSQELDAEAGRQAAVMCEEWRQKEEPRVRKDAIGKSEAVIRGKVTEHLIPFFPEFTYNPKDARFLGTPVDFIVFDGISGGDTREVVFIEIKTGRDPGLSPRERTVRECIEGKRVSFHVIHHPERSGTE